MSRNTSVMGIYQDRVTVSEAVKLLYKAGYEPTDVSALLTENQGTRDFAHEKQTKASHGAAIGALAGGVVGAAAGWFICTQPAMFTGLGLGTLTTAGPLLAALAGAGAGGAVGWIAGLLAGTTMTEYVARRYAGRIRRGGILVSVHCDSPEWCVRAKKTLKDTGARDISSASEASADFGTTDKPMERAPALIPVRVETPVVPPVAPVTEYVPVEIVKWEKTL
jgi:hypothetical protein